MAVFSIQAQIKEGRICLLESPETFTNYLVTHFEKVLMDMTRF